ncbi:transglutaminase superfamily protein [Jejuia pallidilutea]|uniref:Transglutaminase superfamily protein n=1 Tax=Jejuia pallidilutea TaxID=504487 RepID=A0A362WZY3_9FLAO|nr:DUF3857 and transglutaminase domain-containing protein [Jejuia pallidilutea]PQV48284.1 transglutaminase superfamily protein [Jejuia pallidilutea]
MKYFNTLMLVVLCNTLASQNYDFGKVSKEELTEKSCSVDSTANAAVLYEYRNTYFSMNTSGPTLQTEIHKRIKIYNKEGFDSATETIDLFDPRGAGESVGKIRAYTYNLEGGKIVKTSLDKDQVFKDRVSYNYKQVKFTMPNVKEGTVIELKYRITSPYIWNIDEFVLQREIPIKRIEASLKTPEWFRFKSTSKGYLQFFPKQHLAHDPNFETMVVNEYKLDNVSALKEESYVDNINNYRAGAVFELVSIEIPGQMYRSYAQTWGEVARTIGSSDDYKNQLDKSNSFDEELDELLVGATSDIEKMDRIFKYVKDHIKWNGIDGKSFFHGIRKALKEKKGNTADINLTLVAMLRYAGLYANPVVISTKDNIIPFFPTVDRLNYVIAYTKIGEEKYFLDATEEFSDINVLPVKDYNWRGILIDNPNSVWDEIYLKEPDLALSNYTINANLNEDGTISGNFNSEYSKHKALEFRKNFKDKDLDDFITIREGRFDDIEISEYTLENTDSYKGNVEEKFNFYKEEGADIINDKIYVQPFMFLKIKENPFKLEKRLFPVDFGYPFFNRYIVSIDIPEGYAPETELSPIIMKIPNNLGEFKFYPSFVGGKLRLMVNYKINKAVVSAENYLFLKQFFNEMIIKENEQIVLTKT